ncbi:unnamed protein product [Lupinus luteus]|uniref:Non-specific lipid-transfer protein n=1 Tax=Lupinus luteus TaxID=3873 RepID=A0AAV1X4U2_LUPLU
MRNTFVGFLTLVAIMLLIVEPGQSLVCNDLRTQIAPCITYITAKGGNAPSSECCSGVRAIVSSAPTSSDRRNACECLKGVVGAISGVKDNLLNSLFQKCNAAVKFFTSKNMNCKT